MRVSRRGLCTAFLLLFLVAGLVSLPCVTSCSGEGTTTWAIALITNPTTFAVGATTTITATLTWDGTAQQGDAVTWSASPSGSVTFSAWSTITNASGEATVTATGVTAGQVTITATGPTGCKATAVITVNPAPAPAVTLALSPATIGEGETTTAMATVTNAGVAVSGEAVLFAIEDTSVATFTTVSAATTDAQGHASVSITGVAAGATGVTATALSTTSQRAALQVTGGPHVDLVLTPASIPQGDQVTATATVTNGGAPVAGETVTFALTDERVAGFADQNTAVTNAAGQASVVIHAYIAGTTTVYAEALSTTSAGRVLTVTP